MRARPATFSSKSGIPRISLSTRPESLKERVLSKSLATRYSVLVGSDNRNMVCLLKELEVALASVRQLRGVVKASRSREIRFPSKNQPCRARESCHSNSCEQTVPHRANPHFQVPANLRRTPGGDRCRQVSA